MLLMSGFLRSVSKFNTHRGSTSLAWIKYITITRPSKNITVLAAMMRSVRTDQKYHLANKGKVTKASFQLFQLLSNPQCVLILEADLRNPLIIQKIKTKLN